MSGWIKIHRDIEKHWIYTDNNKFKWWVDLLLHTNFEDKKVLIGSQVIDCKRGQCVMSLKNWADRWGVSKDTARNFLNLLEKEGMILHENLTKTTRITICKFDTYQDSLHDSQTLAERKSNASRTQAGTTKEYKEYKELKEVKKESKKFTPPSLDEVILYFSENGFSAEIAKRAFNFYDLSNWSDSRGNKVKNWKQKMFSVWFKEENKTPRTPQPQNGGMKKINFYEDAKNCF